MAAVAHGWLELECGGFDAQMLGVGNVWSHTYRAWPLLWFIWLSLPVRSLLNELVSHPCGSSRLGGLGVHGKFVLWEVKILISLYIHYLFLEALLFFLFPSFIFLRGHFIQVMSVAPEWQCLLLIGRYLFPGQNVTGETL